jgi:hypothetical protein
MNRFVSRKLSLLALLCLAFVAYQIGNRHDERLSASDTPLHKAGLDFRSTLLHKWKARPYQFLSDFTDLCEANFAGLTLRQAQAKMAGTGQKAEFLPDRSQPVQAPAGMLAVFGGTELMNTWISNTSFFMVLFVDAEGAPETRRVRKVEACVVRNVDL